MFHALPLHTWFPGIQIECHLGSYRTTLADSGVSITGPYYQIFKKRGLFYNCSVYLKLENHCRVWHNSLTKCYSKSFFCNSAFPTASCKGFTQVFNLMSHGPLSMLYGQHQKEVWIVCLFPCPLVAAITSRRSLCQMHCYSKSSPRLAPGTLIRRRPQNLLTDFRVEMKGNAHIDRALPLFNELWHQQHQFVQWSYPPHPKLSTHG